MAKRTIRDLPLAGTKVLMRVDFNVPQESDGTISNDRRIRAALPTIQYALDKGAAVILMSHLGRPKGTDPVKEPRLSLARVGVRLGELLPGVSVTTSPEVVGHTTTKLAGALKPGQVLLLENLRFDPREQKPDPAFAKALRIVADAYVNDAFGTCHRMDASMYAVPAEFAPGTRVVGFLVEKELQILDGLLGAPKQPMVAVMGGAKVSDKINFIEAVLAKVEHLLIGGAMTYTFMAAIGKPTGNSLVEKDKLDLANKLRDKAGTKLVLPVDHLVADALSPTANTKVVEEIPADWIGVDIGPQTIELYNRHLRSAKTVLWNGPMGKFEDEPFQKGTVAVAQTLAAMKGTAVTVVGGGESAEAVESFGLADKISHVSTGGGAFLEYVEGKPFAPLSVIDEQ